MSGFIDDITIYTTGPDAVDNTEKLNCVLNNTVMDYAQSDGVEMDLGPKLRFCHFTSKRNFTPQAKLKLPNNEERELQPSVKLITI